MEGKRMFGSANDVTDTNKKIKLDAHITEVQHSDKAIDNSSDAEKYDSNLLSTSSNNKCSSNIHTDNTLKSLESHEALAIIGRQYGIIKNIMSFLSMANLKKMSQVSTTWNAASRTQQRSIGRTHSVDCFSWETTRQVLANHKAWHIMQMDIEKESLSTGMVRFSRHGLLESKINAIENSPLQLEVQTALKDQIENSMIEPTVAIVFSVGDVELGDNSLSTSKVVNPKSFHLNMSEVEKLLPPRCEIISTCSRGIIIQGTEKINMSAKEIENNGPRVHPAVTAFLLPTFYSSKTPKNGDSSNTKSVKIIPFEIPEYRDYVAEKTDLLCAVNGQKLEDVEDTATKDREIRRQLMKQVFCKNRLKDDDTIKCVIALSNVNQNPSLLKLLYAAAADWGTPSNNISNESSNPNKEETLMPSLAVGGAVGKLCRYSKGSGPSSLQDMLSEYARWEETSQEHSDDDADLLTGERTSSYKRSVGLVFAGEGIEAASVTLPPNIRNATRVTKELEKLKACKKLGNLDDPTSNSFAFMFACCGRGKHFHFDKGNVESKCFKALFPNTPLIGIFGEGEFGWNYLPDEKNTRTKVHQQEHESNYKRRFKKLREEDVCHSYTTVFVVLSINTGDAREDAKAAANILRCAK